jgi:uncharacterized repeat protein (TIGR01451 family)
MDASLFPRFAALSVAAALASSLVTGCAGDGASDSYSSNASGGSGSSFTETTSDPSARGAAGKSADSSSDQIAEAMAYPTGDRRTSTLLLEKTGPRSIRVGQPYQYQLKVTNLTDAPLGGVAIREHVGEGFTISNADVKPTQENGQNVYQIGELKARESKAITVTGTAAGPGQVASCTSVTFNPTLCTVAQVIAPQITVTKAAPQQADICEEILYTYTITNSGTGTETNVKVEDKLPEGLTTIDGQNTVSFTVDEIPQGKSREFTARLKASKTGDFSSQATATSMSGNVQSEAVATKVIAPALELAVKGPEREFVGKTVTYDVSVKNTGSAPARDATLTLSGPPRDAQIVAVGNEGAGEGEARTASARIGGDGALGEIAPGQARQYRVTVPANEAGTITVNAVAKARCASDATAVASTTVESIPALLLEVVDNTDPIRVGENVIYTIRVTNQGTGEDKNVAITATVPAELQFVQAGGTTKATPPQGSTVRFAPVDVLAPGKSAEWTLEAKATKAGDVRFQLDMNSDSLGKNVVETEATRLY